MHVVCVNREPDFRAHFKCRVTTTQREGKRRREREVICEVDDGARVFALDTHLQYTYTVLRGISKIVVNRRELIQIFTKMPKKCVKLYHFS